MKLWKTLASLAVLVMCVTRCDLGTPPQNSGGGGTEVEGIIVDQHGNPAAGIWVRVFPDSAAPLLKAGTSTESFLAIRDSAKTNANGVFKLPNLPSGTYNLVAYLKRNDTTLALFRRSIVVSGNLNLGTDTLRVAGSLVLNVAIQGATLGGAQCYIPGSPYLTLSDLSGICTLTGVPPGVYQISVAIPGMPTGQSGSVAVVSFQVTPAGTVNLLWVSLPPGILPPPDSVWPFTVDAIPTLFIGDAPAGFRDSIAFTGLSRVHTLATWGGGSSAVGRNFNVVDDHFDPRGRVPLNFTVDLRFVTKTLVPSGGNIKVFDARGMITHADSAMPWMNLHRVMSKYRRAAVILNFADSLVTTTTTFKQKLKITRVLIRKNGTPVLDSSRNDGFAGLRPHAFLVEYLNPAVTDSLEILAYGNFSETFGLMYSGKVKLLPNMATAPGLSMQWVGSSSVTIPLCLTAATLPPILISPAHMATGVSTSTQVVWDSACGALGYKLQVATDSAFTALVVNDSNVLGTYRNLSLLAAKAYYWRVATKVSGGVTGWSSVRRFTTAGAGTTLSAPNLLLPAQFATNVVRSPKLTWDTVPAATNYQVQVSTSSTFATFVANDSNVTALSRTLSGLAATTDYYWRVRARSGSASSAFSSVFRFTTEAGVDTTTLAAPVLLTPADSLVNAPTVPTFTWNAVSGATHYQIQVATVSNFTSSAIAFQDTLVTGTSKTGFTLGGTATYYWRVRAKSGTVSGPWSGVRRLTVEPGPGVPAPTLIAPQAFATGVSQTPQFSWNPVAGAMHYQFQISNTSSFAVILNYDTLTTNTAITSAFTFAGNTTYYWRVKARTSTSESGYSEVRSFTTGVETTLATPILLSPVDSMLNSPLTPVFTWNAVSGAAYYQIQISPNAAFNIVNFQDSAFTGTSKTGFTLAGGTTYYWRVRAKSTVSSANAGPWSNARRLTTEATTAPPAIPSLSTTNDTIFTGTSYTVNWGISTGATYYRIQVSADSTFGSMVVNDSVVVRSRTLTSLSGTYYWRVIAYNALGNATSARRRFYVSTITTLAAPTLTSPVQNAIEVSTSPAFTWNTVSGALQYSLQVSTSSTFATVNFSVDSVTAPNKLLTGLANGTVYYWRVRAKAGSVVSAYSTVNSFTTSPAAGVATWITRTSGTSVGLRSVVWTGTQFVAVGENGTIRTSPDGVAWTARVSGTTQHFNTVAWTGSLLVAAGEEFKTNTGDGISGMIFRTSPDGIVWTSRLAGNSGASTITSITMNGTELLATGLAGTFYTSSDGISWLGDEYLFMGAWLSGAYVGTRRVMVSGSTNINIGNGDVAASNIGDPGWAWTSHASGTMYAGTGMDSSGSNYGGLTTVASNGSLFAAVAGGSSTNQGSILTSTDGNSWTTRATGTGMTAVTYTGGILTAMNGSGKVKTSANGIAWTDVVAASSSGLASIARGTGRWVAVGSAGKILTADTP